MESFANFLFLFNQETRKLIRYIENIEKKLINCQLAVVFNETCLNEDILSIYTNIYVYIHQYKYDVLYWFFFAILNMKVWKRTCCLVCRIRVFSGIEFYHLKILIFFPLLSTRWLKKIWFFVFYWKNLLSLAKQYIT